MRQNAEYSFNKVTDILLLYRKVKHQCLFCTFLCWELSIMTASKLQNINFSGLLSARSRLHSAQYDRPRSRRNNNMRMCSACHRLNPWYYSQVVGSSSPHFPTNGGEGVAWLAIFICPTYSQFKLCNCHSPTSLKKHSANGYCSGM
jgi:hypothetical protein